MAPAFDFGSCNNGFDHIYCRSDRWNSLHSGIIFTCLIFVSSLVCVCCAKSKRHKSPEEITPPKISKSKSSMTDLDSSQLASGDESGESAGVFSTKGSSSLLPSEMATCSLSPTVIQGQGKIIKLKAFFRNPPRKDAVLCTDPDYATIGKDVGDPWGSASASGTLKTQSKLKSNAFRLTPKSSTARSPSVLIRKEAPKSVDDTLSERTRKSATILRNSLQNSPSAKVDVVAETGSLGGKSNKSASLASLARSRTVIYSPTSKMRRAILKNMITAD